MKLLANISGNSVENQRRPLVSVGTNLTKDFSKQSNCPNVVVREMAPKIHFTIHIPEMDKSD